jgi:hypothetical protein
MQASLVFCDISNQSHHSEFCSATEKYVICYSISRLATPIKTFTVKTGCKILTTHWYRYLLFTARLFSSTYSVRRRYDCFNLITYMISHLITSRDARCTPVSLPKSTTYAIVKYVISDKILSTLNAAQIRF